MSTTNEITDPDESIISRERVEFSFYSKSKKSKPEKASNEKSLKEVGNHLTASSKSFMTI